MTLMPAGAPTIQIPRWIQLVGVPILALIALLIVGKVVHAVFLFLVAGLIALLLDPLVRALEKLWIPRGLSIAIVYLGFAAALAVVVFAIGIVVVDQTESAANRIDAYLTTESGQPPQTGFEHDVDRNDFVAFGQESLAQVRSDEAAAAGDDRPNSGTLRILK